MHSSSQNPLEQARQKRTKRTYSPQESNRKVIAFDVLRSLQAKMSERQVSKLLEIPNSTMQSWRSQKDSQQPLNELETFMTTPCGVEFLRRTFLAAHHAMHFTSGGIRALQEFLRLSQLDKFIASSIGALHSFSQRYDAHVLKIGVAEEKRLAQTMNGRKISAALDEVFRGKQPCLVAIEPIAGYILLEKFTNDRTATTWTSELKPRLDNLNLTLQQVISDEGKGIKACAAILGAHHVPELFHAQHELSKATSAPLKKQEKQMEEELEKADKKLLRSALKHGPDSKNTRRVRSDRNLKQYGLEQKQERRKRVRESIKQLGEINRPIDMRTGKLQTPEEIKNKFDEQLAIIEECSKEAGLNKASKRRLAKGRKTFDSIGCSFQWFFLLFMAIVKGLEEKSKNEASFFKDVVFPLCYLRSIWRGLSSKKKDEYRSLRNQLEILFENMPYSADQKNDWIELGNEASGLFQRSSSCVEGRNGMLSLYYHRFHRLNPQSIRALTIVHNFHIRREDGTSAAERLFGQAHQNLFESVVKHVRIPGKPRRSKQQASNSVDLGIKESLAA